MSKVCDTHVLMLALKRVGFDMSVVHSMLALKRVVFDMFAVHSRDSRANTHSRDLRTNSLA
jgi:hypothetical protein